MVLLVQTWWLFDDDDDDDDGGGGYDILLPQLSGTNSSEICISFQRIIYWRWSGCQRETELKSCKFICVLRV